MQAGGHVRQMLAPSVEQELARAMDDFAAQLAQQHGIAPEALAARVATTERSGQQPQR
jgi:hypothetical protein